MTLRSVVYWFLCTVFAGLVVQSAEPPLMLGPAADWSGPAVQNARFFPVPEPGRAMLLFVGIMAMAFTYRRAWMNWKSGPKT